MSCDGIYSHLGITFYTDNMADPGNNMQEIRGLGKIYKSTRGLEIREIL